MSRIKVFIIIFVFGVLSLLCLQLLARNKFEEFLTNKMFEIPQGSDLPKSLANIEKIITFEGKPVQTFQTQGNPNTSKDLIIYPGLKGVFFYIESIVNNPDLLYNYRTITTFNYPSQGKTSGVATQNNINRLGQHIYDTFKTNNTTLACLSNGAIPCTFIQTLPNTTIKLIHPFLSAGCIIENVLNNYYDYNKLSGIWLETKKTAEDVARLEFLKNNKFILNLIFLSPKDVDFLKINNDLSNNYQVYIATIDEYFSKSQYDLFFPNAILTGAKSHTDIDPKELLKILIN
jgi:hypothetical protein